MRRNLVVGAVACAAALGLLGVLRLARPGPVAAVAVPVTSEEGPRRTTALEQPVPAPAPSTDRAPAIEAPPPDGARAEVASPTDPPDGVTVRVVGPDAAPVAGAEVSVLAGATEGARQRFRDPDRVDALVESQGERRTTDGAGLVTVPLLAGGPTLLVARKGPLWGSLALDPEDEHVEPVELALVRDTSVRARVVTTSGTPVPGIGVQLLHEDRGYRWAVQEAPAQGDEAMATLRHVQESFREYPAERWALGLDALFDGGAERALDPQDPPAEIVTLVMPPTGAVEVTVTGEDGAPYTGEGFATVGIIGEGQSRELSPFSDVERREMVRRLEDGVARLPHVEPGKELEVAVQRGRSDVATKVYGPGPAVPGATRTFEVRLGSDHPVGRVRVVDAAGRPVVETELRATVFVIDSFVTTSDGVDVRTDASGAFLVDLDRGPTEGARREIVVTPRPPHAAELAGRLDASRRLTDGVQELGVVRLEPPPVLVAGRVITPAGEPVAGAELRLLRRVGNAGWRLERLEPRSDEDGRFEVRDARLADELRLRATTDGATSATRTFAAGTEDLVLEIAEGGAIEGRVLLDASIPTDRLRARLVDPDPSLEHSERNAAIDEQGGFRFEGLASGSYRVAVLVLGLGDREVVDGIVVTAGRTTRDARLDPLDLRGRLFAHRVTLTLPDDVSDLEGHTSFGAADSDDLEHHLRFYEPEFWLVAADERIDLVVSGLGFASVRLDDVGGEIAVTLLPTPPVRLVLPSDVRLPEPPVYLKAVLAGADQDDKGVDWGAGAFDEGREILVRVPGTGEMRVRWIVERHGASSSTARTVDLEPPQIVHVDGSGGQRIKLELSPEQRARILPED